MTLLMTISDRRLKVIHKALTAKELCELNDALSKIEISGERYPAQVQNMQIEPDNEKKSWTLNHQLIHC